MSLFIIPLTTLVLLSACSGIVQAKEQPSCPVTKPQSPIFTPAQPWPAVSPYENTFWYGNKLLWTMLQTDGTWHSIPAADGGYVQKLVWWNADYDWRTDPMPDITVRGHSLDGEAPDFEFNDATNMYHPDIESAMLVGASIPTSGCWEITGIYGNEQLSYVVLIVED